MLHAIADAILGAAGLDDLVRRGLRLNWFLSLPAAVGLATFGEPIVLASEGQDSMSLLAAFVEGVIGGNKDVLTALLACFSIGVAIGALLAERIARGGTGLDKTPYAALAIGALSVVLWFVTPRGAEGVEVGLLALLSDPSGIALFVFFVALAVFSGIYITPMNTLLQRSAPRSQSARFIACSNVIDSLAMVLSSVVGLMLNAFGLVSIDIFVVVGLTAIPVAFLAATLSPNHPLARMIGK